MLNTSERLEDTRRIGIVDDYARNLMNSGYDLNYTRKVMVGGLTGYERKLGLSKKTDHPKWKPLHQGAKFNAEGRKRKKMLAKVYWLKKRKRKKHGSELQNCVREKYSCKSDILLRISDSNQCLMCSQPYNIQLQLRSSGQHQHNTSSLPGPASSSSTPRTCPGLRTAVQPLTPSP